MRNARNRILKACLRLSNEVSRPYMRENHITEENMREREKERVREREKKKIERNVGYLI